MARPTFSFVSASRKNYKEFIKRNPYYKKRVSYRDFSNILYGFGTMFMEDRIMDGDIQKLPWGLGPIAVSSKKTKAEYIDNEGKKRINLSIDWKATREAGERIYHMNEHTDGHRVSWYWSPVQATFKMSKLFSFEASDKNKRLLAKITKTIPGHYRKYLKWK